MSKFGRIWFNGGLFGRDVHVFGFFGKSIGRIPLGLVVRKQLGKRVIFQIVRGNGYYGSKLGKAYQTIKKYFVPSSINNPEGQAARDALAAGVANWQGFNPAQKKIYNDRADAAHLKMAGYHLYIREYVRANA